MAAGKSKATSSSKTEGGDRDKAIKLALDQIERQFGKGSIMRLGESAAMDVDVIPTGAISLDAAYKCWRHTARPCHRAIWP